MNKCYFCDSVDTTYCGLCGHSFCKIHEKDFIARFRGAVKEGVKKIWQ